ncbi:DUF421 domain-containing protein [Alteribacillus sp. YIM 98480]|uniref:DUF421 domain-containing protein n=1 Tax=Alteribacillus sp. YIM 98480 TaxID=2606599 RepID=UPI00131DFDE6|nr:DUF421 domain-containing protein [Alteribacillus sp. YIM 98480]
MILSITLKLIIGFFVLFLLIRIVGKKLINQITPFTFIAAIVLSELLGNAVYQKNTAILHVLYTMVLWGGLLFAVEYLSQKFLPFRHAFDGKPSMVIRNGKIDFDQLKNNRMNINQLQSLLRQSEVFSIREVAYAFIEPNGAISILKKSPYQKTTLQDLNLPPHSVYLPVTLIRDGELLHANLQEIEKDKEWLKNQLERQGIANIETVLFAEWLENDGLFVIPYEQHSVK